ncbi:unnamed protein product [Cyclocybe aegerita]|uniref:Uncharacterized protein n=1 Tax=Cyclocybe aegerita TaxID=1973307 RepID=A0A8S0XTV6_CYCAE|nr:unnamed protein product [Cyclocybe aegerita]
MYAVESLDYMPRTHPTRGVCLLQLGACLFAEADVSSNSSIERCIPVFRDAWKCTMLLPASRIEAAFRAAKCFALLDQPSHAAQVLKEAGDLMPDMEPRWTSRKNLQSWSALPCLALPAAACMMALKAGKSTADALLLLEKSRGRTQNSKLDFRTEVSLTTGDKESVELIRKFNQLRVRAEASTFDFESHKLTEELKTLAQQIRQRPGLEDFMVLQRRLTS